MSYEFTRDWNSVEFGEIVAHSAFGPRFSGELYTDNGNVATLRTTDLSPDGKISYATMPLADIDEKKFSKHFLKKGDLVISRSGRIGTTAIFDGFELPVLPGAFLIKFRLILEKVNPRFYVYYFNSPIGQELLKSIATGAAQQNINITNVKELRVPHPPLNTQNAIVTFLSTYDDLIENNTRRIEILEEMARRLYEEWFVHFRFPGHEEVRFKESELGRIPEEWEPVAFSDVASFMNGFAFKPSHFTDDGLPVIKIKELKSGVTAYTPRCSGEVKEKYLIKDGDLLFSWSAHLEAYIWKGGKGWLNQHLFKVDGIDGIPNSFLYFSLKEKMVDFRSKSMGTTMQHIKRSALNEVKFSMPLESLISQFDDLVTPILNQILVLKRKNTNLRSQRDLLLPKLVSGEIDVSNIPMPDDKEVEDA